MAADPAVKIRADQEVETSIDVVLVDDHAIVRQGLRAVLEREADIRVVAEASSPAEALSVLKQARPHIVVLDLKLSPSADSEGLEVCAQVSRDHPDVSVLVFTTMLDDQLVVDAIHSGAKGYVVKDVDTTELVRAIRAVRCGGSAFDARSAAAMVRSFNAVTVGEGHRLTDRELEVMRMIAEGMSNRAIGKQLYISETTVKFHVGNIMRKLEVTRRAEAVYAASKIGLI
jgi:two-component system, NarL family, response regulator DevR